MKKTIPLLLSCVLLLFGCTSKNSKSNFTIDVSFASSLDVQNLDGRLLLMLSTDATDEPRFQINDGLNTQLIYGMNVSSMKAGETKRFDETVFGFPYPSISEVPPGEYQVQALLHVYETFNLATGQTVKLPMDNGEGQQWNKSPGNLYSKPFTIHVTESGISDVSVVMDQQIPPIEEPEDTAWIKHIHY